VPIRWSVRPLGPQATCCTARRRTPVTNANFRGASRPVRHHALRRRGDAIPAAAFCVSRTPSQRTFHVQ
jgi:hypothetical protein